MTKQEYQEKLLCIKADNVGFRLLEGIKIRNQYIYSLEDEDEKLKAELEQLKAETIQLKADNLDLMSQVEINGKALDLACDIIYEERGVDCPALCYKEYVCNDGKGCNHLDQLYNSVCWKEYFIQQAKGGQDA